MADFADSFASWFYAVIQDNAWVNMWNHIPFTLPTGGGLGTGPVWAIYYYNAIDTASSSAQPVTITLCHVGGTVSPLGGTAVLGRYDTNAVILSTTAPHELNFLTIKNRCFIAGASLTGGSVPTIITKYPTATSYAWGKAGPSAVLAYAPYSGLADGDHPNIKIARHSGAGADEGIQTTSGSVVISSGGAGSFVMTTWDGKTIVVNNGTETYKINTITSATAGSLTTNASANRGPDAPYEVHYGQLSWGSEPPQYSYSYYNPTTGHSTNIAPVLRLSEEDMTDVGVELTNIPLTNDANYTRVIIWRTEVASGGSTLWPLKLDSAHGGTATIADGMINNNAVGTVTYRDNLPDTQLTLILGDFVGPIDNDPPPADIKFMEYWDGRVWANTSSEPWRLIYSRQTTPDELGVGEESFPARLFLDIPANDGIITGMHVVGGTLMVCTDRYIYAMVGSSESSYRLDRVSARGGGVGHFAIDDHPGDTTTNTSSAVYASRDKRLWRHYPGGRLEDLGAPIQNKLNAADLSLSKPFIVRVFQKEKNWYLAVGVMAASATKYDFYFFDFDSRAWMDFGFTSGILDGLSIGSGIEFSQGGKGWAHIGRNTGQQIYSFMADTFTAGAPGIGCGRLLTQLLDFGDINSKKSLQEIVYYVSDTAATDWGCIVRFDDPAAATTTLTQFTATGSPRYRGPGIIRWSAANVGVKQWSTIQVLFQMGGPASATRQSLYKVEIVYTIESTGASGRPSG